MLFVVGFINLLLVSYPLHCSFHSPIRRVPPIVQTTVQSITITSRKDCIKEETSPTVSSPTSPLSPTNAKSPLSPPPQPSLLASLLARKKSTVTVPASKEISPPQRGTNRPSPDRLLYTPHSPFHLFSYDLDEESKPKEEPAKTTPPRSDGLPQLLLPDFCWLLTSSCTLLDFFSTFFNYHLTSRVWLCLIPHSLLNASSFHTSNGTFFLCIVFFFLAH